MIINIHSLGGRILKIKSKALVALTLFLIIGTLVAAFTFPVFAVKEDYSNPNATDKLTLNSADILERALGIDLSDAESEYLALFGGESITYGERVPTSSVMSEYFADTDSLLVIAKIYEYTTSSGFKMTWTPIRAVVGETEQSLAPTGDGRYSATFANAGEQGSEQVRVIYSTSVAVSRKTVNSIINQAYNDAALWAEYADTIGKKTEYADAMLEYEKYLAERNIYAENYAAYMKYLDELAEYESALAVYEKYTAELEEYNAKYAEYSKYLEEKKEYDRKVALYEEYLKNIETVAYHISLIDGVKNTSTSLNRAVYNAIVGDTVTQVIENKDVIANNLTGIGGAVIDLAGEATENLRSLFADYFALTDEADKYLYYTLNYEKFRDNFTNLLKSLDYLYENGKVRVALGERDGMKEKYEILLAQLYYVVTALNDGPVSKYSGSGLFDSSYKILGKTPLSILGTPYMTDKNNAKPLSSGYPVKVEMPTITEVEKPIKPTPVLEPVPPKEVADPGDAPEEVARPTPPTLVDAPYPLDDPDVLPTEVQKLITAYESGALAPREEIAENKRITLEITAEKKFLNIDEILIRFYGSDGALLDDVNAERFSYVEFAGSLPSKNEDDYASYSFIGWQTEDGTLIDMTSVDCDGYELDLYPAFAPNYKLYEVKWLVDGNEIIAYERLGDIPEFHETPSKADTDGVYYEFVGWDVEPAPVSTNEDENVYRAVFDAKFILPFSNGSGALLEFDGTSFIADCTLSSQKRFNIANLLPRAAKTGGIVILAKGFTLEISYSDVIKMNEAGVAEISVTTSQRGIDGYSFAVSLYDADGAAVKDQIYTTVTLPFRFSDPENMRLYYDTGDGKEFIRAVPDEKSLTVSALCGVTHYAVTEYSVDVMENNSMYYISVDKTTASAGERVKIYCHENIGYDILSVYLIDTAGEETELTVGETENSYEFVMPAEGVSVGVECRALEYTVNFVSDGKVLSSQVYKYGEIPTPPNAPQKASDGAYRYEFVGWNYKVDAVSADKVYRALYKAIPLPVKEKPDGLIISDSVMRLIMRALTLCGYACVIFLPAATVITVKLVRRKRRYLPKRVKKTPKK